MLRSACRNTSMQVTALSVRIKIVKALHLFSQPLPADWLVSSRSQQVTAIAMRREGLLCQESWDHPVFHGGNTETTQFSVRLRYHLLPNRGRGKGFLLQPGTQILQERLHPDRPFDGVSGLPVDPGRPGTLVRRDPVPGDPQERRVADEIEQIIKSAAPIGHRPTVQLGLQFRYP